MRHVELEFHAYHHSCAKFCRHETWRKKKIGTIRLEHGTQYKHQESSIYF